MSITRTLIRSLNHNNNIKSIIFRSTPVNSNNFVNCFSNTTLRFEENKVENKEENKESSEETYESVEKCVEDINKYKEEIKALKEKQQELEKAVLYAKADEQNTRKIAQRDIFEAKKFGIGDFAKSLLEVNDNLQRALKSVVPESLENNKELKDFYDGVALTQKLINKSFNNNGLKEINPLNKPFDPDFHESLFQMPYEEGKENIVGQVITTGYTLNSRVIREAKVGVHQKNP